MWNCTKAVHSVTLWTRATSQVWTCVRKCTEAAHSHFEHELHHRFGHVWSMYRSSPFRSTLNTSYITGVDMCEVCTEAVHFSQALIFLNPPLLGCACKPSKATTAVTYPATLIPLPKTWSPPTNSPSSPKATSGLCPRTSSGTRRRPHHQRVRCPPRTSHPGRCRAWRPCPTSRPCSSSVWSLLLFG